MKRWFWIMLLGSCCAHASAEDGDAVTKAIAESWLGRDSMELLSQWPVDRGFYTDEQADGSMAYTWNFGVDAHSFYVEDTPTAIGQYGNTTIVQRNFSRVDVRQQRHCVIVFHANSQGVVDAYEFSGMRCKPYAKEWGRPKH